MVINVSVTEIDVDKEERGRADYYKKQLGKRNLWFVTEFLSSMTQEQFLTLPYYATYQLSELIASRHNGAAFEAFFPDEAVTEFIDTYGNPLRGGRRLEYWEKLGQNTPAAKLHRQKQKLRDCTLPACENKLREMLTGRRLNEMASRSPSLQNDLTRLRSFWQINYND